MTILVPDKFCHGETKRNQEQEVPSVMMSNLQQTILPPPPPPPRNPLARRQRAMTEFISVTDRHLRSDDDPITEKGTEPNTPIEDQEDSHTARGKSSPENNLRTENKDQLAKTKRTGQELITMLRTTQNHLWARGLQQSCV